MIHVYLTYPFVLSWSMLEAVASGCVVIVSDTAPVKEVVVDGVNGLLVDFFDSKEISRKVCGVLKSGGDFGLIRDSARSTAIRFDIKHEVKAYFDIFDRAISDCC